MPGQHDIDKICVSTWIARETAQSLRKAAKDRKETLTDYVIALFERATRNVVLTPEDYEQIARETRAAQERKDRRRAKDSAMDETHPGTANRKVG